MNKSQFKRKLKKYERGAAVGQQANWMTTYADMITLLLTFFILLYSFSTINPVKWGQLTQIPDQKPKPGASLFQAEPANDGGISDKEIVQQMINEIKQNQTELQLQQVIPSVEFTTDKTDNTEIIEIPHNQVPLAAPPPPDLTAPENTDITEYAAGGQTQANFGYIYDILNNYVTENGYASKIEVQKNESYVMLRFEDNIFFEPGKADVNSEGQKIIKFMAAAINAVINQVDEIKIAGHTDNVPQNSNVYPSNWYLSMYRAANVEYYLENAGIPGNKMVLMGYGEERPIADNSTGAGRAANRRVEIFITKAELYGQPGQPATVPEITD